MKKIFSLSVILHFATALHAQTFNEWFHQKETRIKYMLEQMASNQVYLQYLEEGYEVARKGWIAIQSIKEGDYRLHELFFNSLSIPNSKIQKLGLVADLLLRLDQIRK